MGKIDAIYARQSIDKKDSISIESQIEYCIHELQGSSYREYQDKGYTGKNTDRPDFQRLVHDIEAGEISRVVVYKLDRISRSLLDFCKMMEAFQKHGVEFVSCREKFDTSTPIGRAMLSICIVFAQLERETIQLRVTDAWHSRSAKGFKMGGKVPYGFRTEPYEINGIKTKRLVAEPTEAEFVKMMFDMYLDPRVSLHDIIRRLTSLGIHSYHDKNFTRTSMSVILRNPIYVKADIDVYEFFKSNGTEIISEAADFIGVNGCYYYQGRGVETKKHKQLQNQTLVLAPHEGFIPSDIWLECRKKLLASKVYQPARKARNTWMAGKIKCGRCGYALMSSMSKYLRCTVHSESGKCPGAGRLRIDETEATVFADMVKKLDCFKMLTSSKQVAKFSPKLAAKQTELKKVESDIAKLVESLISAGSTLVSYVNARIEELDIQKQSLIQEIGKLKVDSISSEQIEKLSGYLDNWSDLSFADKQDATDILITRIRATSERIDIDWKI